jgi:hypothetical protein
VNVVKLARRAFSLAPDVLHISKHASVLGWHSFRPGPLAMICPLPPASRGLAELLACGWPDIEAYLPSTILSALTSCRRAAHRCCKLWRRVSANLSGIGLLHLSKDMSSTVNQDLHLAVITRKLSAWDFMQWQRSPCFLGFSS